MRLGAVIALMAAFFSGHAEPVKLPTFPGGWSRLMTVPGLTHEGKVGARLAANVAPQFLACGISLDSPPIDRELKFTMWIRTAGPDHSFHLNSFAYDKGQAMLSMKSSTVEAKKGVWVKGESVFCVPPGTVNLTLFLINDSGKPVDVADPNLEAGGPMINALAGDGILRASSGSVVTGKDGTVIFPIPGPTAEQAPISFHLTATPANTLVHYDIKRRECDNWVCEAHVLAPGPKPASLRWESLVLIHELPKPIRPTVKISDAKSGMTDWLASTPVVQSADPAIVKKAKELRTASKDLADFAERVIIFTSVNQGTGKPFVALDAASALGCGGSCTSRANLGAALLRAGGVPARTISHLPTWAYGSPLYEHWLIEYWHPGAGWVRLETTQGEVMPRASTFAVLATASVSDEKLTGKAGQLGWILPGAAWMSGIQGSGSLQPGAATEEEGSANWCRPERRLAVSPDLFNAAKAPWPNVRDDQWVSQIEAKFRASTGDELLALLRRQVGSSLR